MEMITTNFTIADGYLAWNNEAFNGGAAKFCAVNSTILTVFNGSPPPNCVPVKLLALSAGKRIFVPNDELLMNIRKRITHATEPTPWLIASVINRRPRRLTAVYQTHFLR